MIEVNNSGFDGFANLQIYSEFVCFVFYSCFRYLLSVDLLREIVDVISCKVLRILLLSMCRSGVCKIIWLLKSVRCAWFWSR